jgi:hypothetical protein
MPERTNVGFFKRLIYALVGLLAGEAALLATLLPHALAQFTLYAIFSFIGWVLVGVPIAVAIPARLITNIPWPLWVLIATLLGPLALSIILLLLGRGHTIGFAHTGSFWPISIVVSTVSAIAYAALLRKEMSKQG